MPDTAVVYMNPHLTHCGQAKGLKLRKDHEARVECDLEANPRPTPK